MESLIPVSMGLWAFWTWSQDREQERQKERARLAALYVNPFLSACEDLQSRIYHILELGGLRALRQRYSDGAYAAETLYLIVRYFGWETVVHRYGPYTQDPVVMRIVGTSEDTGKLLGLDKNWMVNALKATGNYGEIFERNVGPNSALKLPRGLNSLWNKGGIMYAPPVR